MMRLRTAGTCVLGLLAISASARDDRPLAGVTAPIVTLVAAQAGSSAGSQSPPSLADLALSVRERVRLEAQVRRARGRLEVLARESDALAAQQRSVLGDLRRLELERERRVTEEEVASAAGALAQAALRGTEQSIDALQAAVAAREPAVRARLRRLYVLGPLDAPRHWVRPDGLASTARAWRLLATLSATDRELLAAAARDREALEGLRTQQALHAAEAERLAATAREARAAAARAVAARQALLARLEKERDLSARFVTELQQAEHDLSALLASTGGSAPPGPGADGGGAMLPLGPFKGDLDWPVDGAVLTRFGQQREARFGTVLPHNGVEIGARESTAVRSPHEGRVVFADSFAGLGRLVIVEHEPATFSLYGHLGGLAVSRGDAIVRGTPLGSVGRTPAGIEALYFELRIDGQPVDPLEWMRPTPSGRGSR
jgi:septal ring factor EnvC (AmiA/AmiB activator)